MRHSLFLLCGIVLFALGCADTEQPVSVVSPVSPDVQDDEALTTETRLVDMLENMTEEERGLQVIEHLKAYLQLKARSPDAAYAELEKAAYFSWWGHPLSEEWAQLMFRIDDAGKAALPEMIRLYEMEVEMAKDRSPHKEYVTYLERRLAFWEGEKEAAEALGQAPEAVLVEYSIEVRED